MRNAVAEAERAKLSYTTEVRSCNPSTSEVEAVQSHLDFVVSWR